MSRKTQDMGHPFVDVLAKLSRAGFANFAEFLLKCCGNFWSELMTQLVSGAVECGQQRSLQFRRCSVDFVVELWIGRVRKWRAGSFDFLGEQQAPMPPQ